MKTSETLYRAMDVAVCIIRCANRISNGVNYLHLQKLLYFVQAYSFILYGKPIFEDEIYASPYAVQIKEVEKHYREFGGTMIRDKDIKADIYYQLSNEDIDLVEKVVDYFKDKSSVELAQIIYKQKPWKDGVSTRSMLITKESLRAYFYHPEKEFTDLPKRSESKPKRYRIKPGIVKNFVGGSILTACFAIGFRIDWWLLYNHYNLLFILGFPGKVLISIAVLIDYIDNHKEYEAHGWTLPDRVKNKIRSTLFEEV